MSVQEATSGESSANAGAVAFPQQPSDSLGRLVSVPLREVWPHEAQDFTPWLLRNPEVLGDVLGMDLELTRAEHPVGGFSLDLIGRNASNEERVIVENQLEVSDHNHLGQLLTYASGTDATNIVWVASAFREEHRAALDWLNARTDERTRFFGVEVDAVRIGDSPAAPLLKLAVGPNDWNKIVKATAASQSGGERAQLYMQFWASLLDRVKAEQLLWTNATKAPGANWIALSSGTSGVLFGTNFSRKGLCSEIYFGDASAETNLKRFQALHQHRAAFEAMVDYPVEWQELQGKKSCKVAIYSPDTSIEQEHDWPDYLDWFIATQKQLRAAYSKFGS
jgi:hypothetical protein